MKQSINLEKAAIALDRQAVYHALQQWRDSAETQALMQRTPDAYDAVIALQAKALEHAHSVDPRAW